jgi:hypothetical protein
VTRVTPIKAGLVLVVLSGLLHGVWTRRWKDGRELETAVARLNDVPLTVGEWSGRDEGLDAQEVAQAGLAGTWRRRYVHRRTGATLTVLLMCGRSGAAAVHTPEWCYRGVGYEPERPQRLRVTDADGTAAEFWAGKFRKPDAVAAPGLRIFWGWNASGAWQAPDYPRLAFARYPALYKLYIVRELTSPGETLDEDPTVGFLQEFLPVADRALFASPAP